MVHIIFQIYLCPLMFFFFFLIICSLNEPDHSAQSPQGVTEPNYSKHQIKEISF